MVKDSYKLSHPINVEVKNPNEITSLFDSISYDKVIVLFLFLFSSREQSELWNYFNEKWSLLKKYIITFNCQGS